MTISDYQVNNVIKTYVRNMKSRTIHADMISEPTAEDRVLVSDEGVKRMLFDRIGEKMAERLRRNGQE
jgi:hypothetical protein